MSPSYWINMGAVAISTLAGTTLIAAASGSEFLIQFVPFIKGVTFLCWATATWWIPLLIALGFWRHAYERAPIRYELRYWSIVFPLGMYAFATHAMGDVVPMPFLIPTSVTFAIISLIDWTVTTYGLIRSMVCNS